MKPQYRDELKQLDRVQKKLNRDMDRHARAILKQIGTLKRSLWKGERATSRELARLNKRRAILQGRLS